MDEERTSGRWSRAEHEEFLKCLAIYGREWKKVSQRITSRTAAQIRSHAQKYFKKVQSVEDHVHRTIARPKPRPTTDEALAIIDDTLSQLRSTKRRKRRELGDNELIALEMLSKRVKC
ncbi:hypothetical protein CTAYLR_007188 [Chrysophaeum taylorii]|uniref:Uncharacterized protein n=1 Tax=Chrysophaeum taylorii TaxID=2483200 RepID=A0AAD7XQ26_9STRA|nr:hypothetical protein CTAYLR_007188 [Chrysophaeum taylorii]